MEKEQALITTSDTDLYIDLGLSYQFEIDIPVRKKSLKESIAFYFHDKWSTIKYHYRNFRLTKIHFYFCYIVFPKYRRRCRSNNHTLFSGV
jgi:hypothetical protein